MDLVHDLSIYSIWKQAMLICLCGYLNVHILWHNKKGLIISQYMDSVHMIQYYYASTIEWLLGL